MADLGYGQNGIFWDLPVIGRSAANLIKERDSRSQLLPSALHFPETDSTKNPRSKRNEDFLFTIKPLLNS